MGSKLCLTVFLTDFLLKSSVFQLSNEEFQSMLTVVVKCGSCSGIMSCFIAEDVGMCPICL